MMKKVYWVKGQNLEAIDYKAGMDVYDGDVYAFDDPVNRVIWIWIGKDSSVEEYTVGAWLVNKIDQERGGVPEVLTINQDEEPMPFKENFSINVVDDDTPGFLRRAELDEVEFKLYRVYIEVDTKAFDEAKVEEVEISKDSLTSDDVYILDGNEAIYCWIGRSSQLEEKRMGQKIMQKIDAERHYMPLQYTIHEGDSDKTEKAFYTLLDKIEKMEAKDRKAISVEDQRELNYVAEEYKSAEQHKNEINANYESTDPDKVPERIIQAGTDAHKEIVAKGSTVREEELPQMGTVAARLAAINARAGKDDDPVVPVSKPTESRTNVIPTRTPKPVTEVHRGTSGQTRSPLQQVPSTEDKSKSVSTKQDTVSEASTTDTDTEQNKANLQQTEPDTKNNEPKIEERGKMFENQSLDTSENIARGGFRSGPQSPYGGRAKPSRDVSPTFGGAPEPELTSLVTDDVVTKEESFEKRDTVKSDCVAVDMHATVWSANKACSVCGMKESDCPNSSNHRSIYNSNGSCPTCGAKE